MLHLHHETLNQADIPSGDAQNRCNRLLVSEIIGMGGDPMTPALLEKKARLVIGQWLDLLREPNSRVELWRALQALIQSRHAQQHQAELPTVRDIAYLLQSRIFEAISFINNQELDQRRIAARRHIYYNMVTSRGYSCSLAVHR